MEKEYEVDQYITYPDALTRLRELKDFYDYKREQDKKEPSKNSEDWEMIPTMFEVAIEIVSARMEKREAKKFSIEELVTTKQACTMLLNFSYACDYLTTGFVTFEKCYGRGRRFYEFSFENIIKILDEEINKTEEE